jgi:hypothetical protein
MTTTERIAVFQLHWEALSNLTTDKENSTYGYFLNHLEDLIVDLRKQNNEPGF